MSRESERRSSRDRATRRHRAAESRTRFEELGPVTRGRKRPSSRDRRRIFIVGGLVASLIVALAGGTYAVFSFHRQAAASISASTRVPTNVVMFVLEGVSTADVRLARMPNLDTLARNGTVFQNAWVGQLEPSPEASNATLATGLFPRRNGIVGSVWRDPTTGSAVRASQSSQVRPGLFDQIMAPRDSTPLAALVKARYTRGRIVSVGGAGCGAASAAGTWAADYVLCPVRKGHVWRPGWVAGHSLPGLAVPPTTLLEPVASAGDVEATLQGWTMGHQDDWVTKMTLYAMRAVHPRVTVVNYPEVGSIGPWFPPGTRQGLLRRVLEGIDRDIGKIVAETRAERMLGNTVFVVTSDAPLNPASHLIHRAVIDESILAAGAQSVYVRADGSVMIGLQNNLQIQPVAQALMAQNLSRVDAIFYRTKHGKTWTYKQQFVKANSSPGYVASLEYLLSTFASRTSPDVVAVYAPSTATDSGPVQGFTRTSEPGGMQWDAQHIPLIFSGQGVVSGVTSVFPARLVDVMPTLVALLHLPPGNIDGIILSDVMTIPPSGATSAQTRLEPRVMKIIDSLRARGKVAPH